MRMTEYSDTTKQTSENIFILPTTSSLAIAHVLIYIWKQNCGWDVCKPSLKTETRQIQEDHILS